MRRAGRRCGLRKIKVSVLERVGRDDFDRRIHRFVYLNYKILILILFIILIIIIILLLLIIIVYNDVIDE